MTKLRQLYDRHGQSPWLDNLTRGDLTGDHPVWHRFESMCSPASTTDEGMMA